MAAPRPGVPPSAAVAAARPSTATVEPEVPAADGAVAVVAVATTEGRGGAAGAVRRARSG
ncbi:hypothetical protein GCM10022244_18140 [Streptomyces gulbargensis]|uniref:Uncharacterized protein n=1 Tax=Streptomyces gulbargensis TaxID=364901 RepID=A0ABP7LVQ5_9ACTN